MLANQIAQRFECLLTGTLEMPSKEMHVDSPERWDDDGWGPDRAWNEDKHAIATKAFRIIVTITAGFRFAREFSPFALSSILRQ